MAGWLVHSGRQSFKGAAAFVRHLKAIVEALPDSAPAAQKPTALQIVPASSGQAAAATSGEQQEPKAVTTTTKHSSQGSTNQQSVQCLLMIMEVLFTMQLHVGRLQDAETELCFLLIRNNEFVT